MKKTIFLLLTLIFFSPLSSQEEAGTPSVFEALEMLIQEASKNTEFDTEQTSVDATEEDLQMEDPVLALDNFEG